MGEGLKRAFKAAKDTRMKANPMPSNPVSTAPDELEMQIARAVLAEEQVAALQSQVLALREALCNLVKDLEFRANMKSDADERGVVDCGHGVYTKAKEALAATDNGGMVDGAF